MERYVPKARVEGSNAQHQSSNNDRVIATQVYGGLRKKTNGVDITYYGHCAFEITTPRGLKIFIDPWRNDPFGTFGYWFSLDLPITKTDVALITHAHFDHDGYNRLEAGMILDRVVGTWELGDVKLHSIADKHVCESQGKFPFRAAAIEYFGEDPCACDGSESMQWCNNIFIIETGGLRILHWGDNRQNPPDYIWDMISDAGDIDIAMLPVSNDGHILTPDWGDAIMEKLQPKIAIPMHYYVKGVNIPGAGGLETADEWVNRHENTILDTHTVTYSPETIKNLKSHVVYFGDNVPFSTAGASDFPLATDKPNLPEPADTYKRFKH